MTVWQRLFFRRRSALEEARAWQRRRGLDEEATLAALSRLDEVSWAGLERLVQGVIDARLAVLSRSPELPMVAMAESRGAVLGLEDLLAGLRRARAAIEERGPGEA